jgi:hypothetical protein
MENPSANGKELEFVKNHILFKPLQSIIQKMKSDGVFEDPIPKMFSFCSRACAKVFDEGVINEAIDIDDVVLAEEASLLKSKKQPAKTVLLPHDLSEYIQTLQNSMSMLTDEMEQIRPLLEFEKSSRLQALKFPTRMTAVVLKRREKLSSKNSEVKSKKRRKCLPGHTLQLMKNWLFSHAHNPYPSFEEKKIFAESGNLEIRQIDYWFTNARARILKDKDKNTQEARKNHQTLPN